MPDVRQHHHMRLPTILVLVFLLCCRNGDRPTPDVHTHGLDHTPAELARLSTRAGTGDAAAAYDLFLYYSLEHEDERAAQSWLRAAATARHPEAQRVLADLIQSSDVDYRGVASSCEAAVRSLLSDACRTLASACCALASAIDAGRVGTPDFPEARTYLQRGAQMHDSMCWRTRAAYLEEGKGGPVDLAGAYYWISLEAQFVDPRSVSGAELAAIRERLAMGLSREALASVWHRVDAFVATVDNGRVTLESPPFLEGMVPAKLSQEGRSLAKVQEAAHRAKYGAGATLPSPMPSVPLASR